VRIGLYDVTGVYTGLSALTELPEALADPAVLSPAVKLHRAVDDWLATTSARVVNRTSANDTKNSKPYQVMIIRDYFEIPETLVTNEPEAVVAFLREFGRIIYESVSGERSIVTCFEDTDLARASVPVQFQEYVPGTDLGVHVVGTQVFATSVRSTAIDYRYDRSGAVTKMMVTIPDGPRAPLAVAVDHAGIGLWCTRG
jgi:hypothetical protein